MGSIYIMSLSFKLFAVFWESESSCWVQSRGPRFSGLSFSATLIFFFFQHDQSIFVYAPTTSTISLHYLVFEISKVSTAMAIIVQLIAVILCACWSCIFRDNATWAVVLINIFHMAGVGILTAVLDLYLGDDWIAELLPFPVSISLLWLVYTTFFAVYTTVLLQWTFWHWLLVGILRAIA